MSNCDHVLERLDAYLTDELDAAAATALGEHLQSCTSCRAVADELVWLLDETHAVGESLRPRPELEHELSANPCRRWLRLLYSAVDREITPDNLDRLLQHLDGCEACRAAWQDLTLMHQVGAALEPPAHLLARCLGPRTRRPRTVVLGRRFATAAAYVLAVLTSLAIGNPVTMARNDAGVAVQRVAETMTAEVAEVAESGRGEARVILWRVWRWAQNTVDDLRSLVERLDPDDRDPSPEATEGD